MTGGFLIADFAGYRSVAGQYSDSFIRGKRCVKICEDERRVKVAVCEKSGELRAAMEGLHFPKAVEFVEVATADFAEFVGAVVEKGAGHAASDAAVFSGGVLDSISGDAPVVNVINAICLEAIRRNASDIHIECAQDAVRVRYRIDGVLGDGRALDKSLSQPLSARIKVMSNMNVLESRLPQDGRMKVALGGESIDMRVSVLPCVGGQSVVLRLFEREGAAISLGELGFADSMRRELEEAISLPNGLILAAGPTGSGKSTTLHALMQMMDVPHLKIVAIEDPVERRLKGIDQVQVNEAIGLTFESSLRWVLRQDPDVIMIGEIRDEATAFLAVRAALTGHLVLSSLHANGSVASISRLRNLGVEPYLLASVLRCSMAQRLVRRSCAACGGEGCRECGFSGYRGRIAVGEIFSCDDEVSSLIAKDAGESEILRAILAKGFLSMACDAASKVKTGITTQEELAREGIALNAG